MAPRTTPNQAATLALKGLAYLANSESSLGRFLDLSGAGRDTLGARADEPEFLVSLLDFMLTNEELLIGFCDESSTDVRAVHMARHVLAGG
jgi:Protein of unknown function (DUF3572)